MKSMIYGNGSGFYFVVGDVELSGAAFHKANCIRSTSELAALAASLVRRLPDRPVICWAILKDMFPNHGLHELKALVEILQKFTLDDLIKITKDVRGNCTN